VQTATHDSRVEVSLCRNLGNGHLRTIATKRTHHPQTTLKSAEIFGISFFCHATLRRAGALSTIVPQITTIGRGDNRTTLPRAILLCLQSTLLVKIQCYFAEAVERNNRPIGVFPKSPEKALFSQAVWPPIMTSLTTSSDRLTSCSWLNSSR